MTVDPKLQFWFGVLTSILLGVGSNAVHLPAGISPDIAAQITSWCSFLGWINTMVLTAGSGFSAPKAGPLVSAPVSPTGTVVKILIAAFVLSLFLAGSPALAQAKPRLTGDPVADIKAAITPPPSTASAAPAGSVDKAVADFNGGIQKITKDLVDKAIADVTAAQTDAQNHNDQISKPCWDANLALLKSLPSQWENPPPSPIGIALGIQIQRDLLNAITGNDATSLKVACAALWGDQLRIVGNLGALLGIRIATGGLL